MTTERHAAAKLAAPTINLASVVHGLDAYMRSRGADAGEALRRAGLEPGDLTDPDRRVPLIRYLELLEICADLVADPQFGLKFGAQYEPRHAGVVGNVALASRTVSETNWQPKKRRGGHRRSNPSSAGGLRANRFPIICPASAW
jgi:Arabinose-binding domain of AraC transcription regulator, N-term